MRRSLSKVGETGKNQSEEGEASMITFMNLLNTEHTIERSYESLNTEG
jgi:hypothetical protein